MKSTLGAAVLVSCALLQPAAAQEAQPPRYTMSPIDGGVIRLDTQTGQVSTCVKSTNGLTCRSAADDRAGFEDEIARLARENAELKQRLASTEPGKRGRLQLPSDEEVDQALGFFDRLARRFKRIVEGWQKDEVIPNRI